MYGQPRHAIQCDSRSGTECRQTESLNVLATIPRNAGPIQGQIRPAA